MRHVPSSDTIHAGVLSFEDALLPTAADYDRGRWLYVPDHYSEYRYILGTRGEHPLICIGINPSTAAPDRLDNTLKSAQRIALNNGYDSFIMFNVYAQRATLPDDMEKVLNPVLHRENMKAFTWVLEGIQGPPHLWAAWGAIIEKRDYLPGCVRDMIAIGRRFGACWFTAGARSKAGHPHHPLYLKSDSPLDSFTDLDVYLDSLRQKGMIPDDENV
ncbi:MAG: DUF1643 domain-containing protein [Clostridiales bacterium]|nr:DUF1643 domain-containing protein [Clostridiales bacterium]